MRIEFDSTPDKLADNNKLKKTVFFRLFEKIRQIFEKDSNFQVDKNRAKEYLLLDREITLGFANKRIPIGKKDFISYTGEVTGSVSDRSLKEYQVLLFPDCFDTIKTSKEFYFPEVVFEEGSPKKISLPLLGGYEGAFSEGKTILDIASGEALGLMLLSMKFSKTTFIGVDILYKEKRPIHPSSVGLQLSHGNWESLECIPNSSIDTILSLQGVTMWGLSSKNNQSTENDTNQIIESINRVSKIGTILRMDRTGKEVLFEEKLKKNWEVVYHPNTLLAIKTQ